MIAHLLNFILCSALLLLAYQLLLKNKAMYQFNRFYLLMSILLSLAIPFISIKKELVPLPVIQPAQMQLIVYADNQVPISINTGSSAKTPVDYAFYIPAAIYCLVTSLLLFRFAKNLYTIRKAKFKGELHKYQQTMLVLTEAPLTPHTFLGAIFLYKSDYQQGKIQEAVLRHELTHARQFHSIDIILIELLQAFCWFNPLILFYRRAMQLNHEFIADSAVLQANYDVANYQNLLVSMIGQSKSVAITSQFNYSITKKRLIMMTKTTSTATAWFARLMIVLVLIPVFILCCNKTDAQQDTAVYKKTAKIASGAAGTKEVLIRSGNSVFASPPGYPSTKAGISAELMKEYNTYEAKYATKRLSFDKTITKPEEDYLEHIYQQMSPEQQKNRSISFEYPAEPLSGSSISRKELATWNDPAVYGVWVDGKRVKNADLNKFNSGHFKMVFFSRLTPAAVKNDKFHYQIDLMTLPYYKKYRQQAILNRNNSMIIFHLKS